MINTATPKAIKDRNISSKPPWLVLLVPQVAWFLIAAVILVVLLELLFAWAHVGEEEYLAADPILGSSHIADKMVTFRSEGYSRELINSAGFRDFAYTQAKPAETVRIAVLGDSVTEGLQVPLSDTFAKVMERQLTSKYGRNVQVLNFAMSGYGTGQEFVQLLHQVAKYHPDLVLLAYQVGDSDDNILQPGIEEPIPRPYFSLDDKNQLLINWNVLNSWPLTERGRWFMLTDWLRQHSRIVAVLSRLQLSLNSDKNFQNMRKLGSKLISGVLSAQPAPSVSVSTLLEQKRISQVVDSLPRPVAAANLSQAATNHAEPQFAMYAQAAQSSWLLNAEIIRQINNYCRTQQCKLIVAALPAPNNCFFYFQELKALERLAFQEGFGFINVHAKFPARAPMEKSPYYIDYHLSALGHKLVAKDICELLPPN